MSKQKQLIPKLRFPKFRGKQEWKLKRLGVCLKYLQPTEYLVQSTAYDDKFETPVLTAGKTFILGYTNETEGVFDEKFLPVIIFDDFTTASKFVDFPFKAKSSAMKILLTKNNNINIKFIYEAMQRIRYEVGVHERHWISIFSNFHIPIPKIQEQQKIADCFASIDESISTQTEKLNALKNHKKALMQQLFPTEGETTPKLRFPEFRNGEEWKVKPLKNSLLSISNGLGLNQDKNNGYKVTRIETIAEGTINLNKTGNITTEQDISSYKLEIGDILLSNINSLRHIGKTAIVDKDYNLYHGMNLLRLVVDKEKNSYLFFYYLLNTQKVRSSIRDRANPAINQASINQSELGKTLTLIPVYLEQQKIADCLSSIDELITAQAEKIDILQAHKKGLMQQLFPTADEMGA